MNEQEQTSLIQLAIEGFSKALQGLRDAGLLPEDALQNLGQIKVVAPSVPPVAPTAEVVETPRTMPARDAHGHFLKGTQVPAGTTVRKAKQPPARRIPRAPHAVDEFVGWFFRSPLEDLYNVKCGRYECRLGVDGAAHCLYFHSEVKTEAKNANNVVGIRPQTSKIGVFNASALRYSNSRDAQKRPQAAAEAAGAVPIPFENVVAKTNGAGLDLTKLEIIDWTGSERLLIPPVTRRRNWAGEFFVADRHFAGALVIKIEQRYFLFDTDREEINEFGFNPFFTHLAGPVKTVQEAYESLMPPGVRDAIKEGRAVKRQGEFFFVPVTNDELREWFWPASGGNDKLTAWDAQRRTGVHKTIQDFVEVGAAQYNVLQAHRFVQAGEFLKRCAELNGGKIPEGDGTSNSTIDAVEVLGPFLEKLCQRVGPPAAQGWIPFSDQNVLSSILDPESPDAHLAAAVLSNLGSNPTYTYLRPQAEDLARRFTAAVDRETRVGTPKQNEHFMYNMMIGEAARMGGQHRATGVIIPPHAPKDTVLAIGTVSHQGREHRPLFLETPHQVYANTSIGNFTVDP